MAFEVGAASGGGRGLKTRRRRGKSTPTYSPVSTQSAASLQAAMDERVRPTSIVDALAFPGNELARFGKGMYQGADETVRSLIDLVTSDALNNPDVGGMIESAVGQTVENWSDPMKYANENPFGFSLDLLGGVAGGAKVLNRIDDLGGASALLADETGALGLIGRKLERGEFGDVKVSGGGMRTMSATGPKWADANFGRMGRHKVISKQGAGGVNSQGMQELEANRLFRASNAPFPYVGIGLEPSFKTSILMEPIPDFEDLKYADQMTPEGRKSLADISLVDAAMGNHDRGLGHNIAVSRGQPIPYDFGLWGESSNTPATLLDEAIRGQAFTPMQTNFLHRLQEAAIQSPTLMGRKADVVARRIDQLLAEGGFGGDLWYKKPMFRGDAFGMSGSPLVRNSSSLTPNSPTPLGHMGGVDPDSLRGGLGSLDTPDSSLSYATGDTTGSAERAWLARQDAEMAERRARWVEENITAYNRIVEENLAKQLGLDEVQAAADLNALRRAEARGASASGAGPFRDTASDARFFEERRLAKQAAEAEAELLRQQKQVEEIITNIWGDSPPKWAINMFSQGF